MCYMVLLGLREVLFVQIPSLMLHRWQKRRRKYKNVGTSCKVGLKKIDYHLDSIKYIKNEQLYISIICPYV